MKKAFLFILKSLSSSFFHFLIANHLKSFSFPPLEPNFFIMSKHSSLKASGSAGGKRSVMKRFERVKALKEKGAWKEGQSPIGLPKTKVTG